MWATLLAAVRGDIDRQIGWARQEVARQTRHGALIGGLAGAAMLAALGAIVVVLAAVHTWLAARYGPFAAYGIVGGGLLLAALIFLMLALHGRRPQLASRPALQIARPAALLGIPKQRNYAQATTVDGERAFSSTAHNMRHGSRSRLFGMLALAAVVGLIAGRKLYRRV